MPQLLMSKKLKLNGSIKPIRPSRINTKKRCLLHHRGLECKSNRQVWPWSTNWSRAKANRVLPGEPTGYSKNPLSTTQEISPHMDITRWSIPKSDWYVLCSPGWRSSIQSAKTKLRADCGSDHEPLIAKFRLISKKIEKTIRPFRYDLNKIRSDRVPEELWMEVCNTVWEAVIKTIPKKKKCKKAKWLSSEEALQIAEKWKAKEKGKDLSI